MIFRFLSEIPLEAREKIMCILDNDPDAVRRLIQRLALEYYYGIDTGYQVQVCTN